MIFDVTIVVLEFLDNAIWYQMVVLDLLSDKIKIKGEEFALVLIIDSIWRQIFSLDVDYWYLISNCSFRIAITDEIWRQKSI